jgi:hypothetical protein
MTKIEEVQMTRKVLRRPSRRSLGGRFQELLERVSRQLRGSRRGGGGKLASRGTIISLL